MILQVFTQLKKKKKKSLNSFAGNLIEGIHECKDKF